MVHKLHGNLIAPCNAAALAIELSKQAELLFFSCREEIATCSEAAYSSLRLADAQKLMMFKSQKDVEGYAKQVGSVYGIKRGQGAHNKVGGTAALAVPVTATPVTVSN